MFLRRRPNGELRLFTAYRNAEGKPERIDLGIADDHTAKIVRENRAAREAQRKLNRELKSTVKALDELLADDWRDLLNQLKPAMAREGIFYERSEWRRRRKIFNKGRRKIRTGTRSDQSDADFGGFA